MSPSLRTLLLTYRARLLDPNIGRISDAERRITAACLDASLHRDQAVENARALIAQGAPLDMVLACLDDARDSAPVIDAIVGEGWCVPG